MAADSDDDADAWDDDSRQHEVPLIAKPDGGHAAPLRQTIRTCRFYRSTAGILLVVVFGLVALHWPFLSKPHASGCTFPRHGYHCHLPISRQWGQYSPYSSVKSDIVGALPARCEITFAQVLSRHGARFPTSHKGELYYDTIHQLHEKVKSFTGSYSFLEQYQYRLNADIQTAFGQQELVDSGAKFYRRYAALAKSQIPFFRASSSMRVVESARNFTQGFHGAKVADGGSKTPDFDENPYDILQISEESGSNNTLDHGACKAFEEGRYDDIPLSADTRWKETFVPPIQARLNSDLAGASLSMSQVIYLMDLCPFETVASPGASTLSPFCKVFTNIEWSQYSYLQSLDKYYSYGSGNPLGPSQGVGFANELVARMTGQAVQDETSTNHTLDGNAATFPIGNGQSLYADFSHDTQMTSIFSALGLYNATAPLPDTEMQTPEETGGYAAGWVIPFAARAYFEKMKCKGEEEELVRILVNDRVIPLQNCGADAMGRCTLSAWVRSLSFAKENGHWDKCLT